MLKHLVVSNIIPTFAEQMRNNNKFNTLKQQSIMETVNNNKVMNNNDAFSAMIQRGAYDGFSNEPDMETVYSGIFNSMDEALDTAKSKIDECIENDLEDWGYEDDETCFNDIKVEKTGSTAKIYADTVEDVDPEDRVFYVGNIVKVNN